MSDQMFDRAFAGYSYSYPHKSAYRQIAPPISVADAWSSEQVNSLFLYLHIPFCEFRCGFCNLFTHVQPDQNLVDCYLNAIETQAAQIRKAVPDSEFSRLAIGGGTPTYLSIKELERVFTTLNLTMGANSRGLPLSCEASPATVDGDKLDFLLEQGVDRLSLGVQSFKKQETGSLGRPQSPDQVHIAIESIQRTGFPIVNLDLIYGAQGQSTESWMDSVKTGANYRPEEIYLYPLYVRQLTGLERMNAKPTSFNSLETESNWDQQRLEAYRAARDYLRENGYQQVSFRMFRRRDSESVDGPIYCCQSDGMIGLGCGARSYTNSLHYSYEYAVNSSAVLGIIKDFLGRRPEEFSIIEHGYYLDKFDRQRRFAIMGLLQSRGLSEQDYADAFGSKILDDIPQLNELKQQGFLEMETGILRLNDAGIEMSDAIGPWLYSSKVNELMETYECR